MRQRYCILKALDMRVLSTSAKDVLSFHQSGFSERSRELDALRVWKRAYPQADIAWSAFHQRKVSRLIHQDGLEICVFQPDMTMSSRS